MKKRLLILLTGTLILSLAGCGSSTSSTENTSAAYVEEYDGGAYEAAADYAMDDYDYDEDYDEDGTAIEELTDENDEAQSSQKLIYTADLNIETLSYTETMDSIRELISSTGGLISDETTSDSTYNWYYSDSKSGLMTTYMTVRIPTDQYETFLDSLEGTGSRILNKTQSVENITRRYNDQTVLVSALETQQERLQEMMQQAETIEEMILIEDRLTEVQTELNQARSRLSTMDTDVAYSTINLTIKEVRETTPTVTQPLTFGERFVRTVSNTASGFIEFIQDFILLLVASLPYLILFGLIIFGIVKLIKKLRKNRKAKQPKKTMSAPKFGPWNEKRFDKADQQNDAPLKSDDNNNDNNISQ